jgi:hypothetical protein
LRSTAPAIVAATGDVAATIAGAVAWWSLLSSREPRCPASWSAASAAKRRQGSG